jgi:DNA-binding FadR family transcriptional regulator
VSRLAGRVRRHVGHDPAQRALADAIAAGDVAAAQLAMSEHLTYTLDLVSAIEPESQAETQ